MPSIDFKSLVKEVEKFILPEIFNEAIIPSNGKSPDTFYKAMRDYPTRPKKYIRPILCFLICQAYGGEAKAAVKTAAAIELFADSALIHDDIQDDSAKRRGSDTLHVLYGVPLAITVGDGLFTKVFKLLCANRKELDFEKTFRILDEFQEVFTRTMEGQAQDIISTKNQLWNISETEYFNIVDKKTSWYTCVLPLRTGAIIGDAPERELNKLTILGRKLGAVVQLQDDIRNIVSKEDTLGREPKGDLFEGKKTLMLIHTLNSQTLPEKDKEEIIRIMKKDRKHKSNHEINYVYDKILLCDSINYAKRKVEKLAEEVRQTFDTLELKDNDAKDKLKATIEFVINRN